MSTDFVICDGVCICGSYLQYQNSDHSDERRPKMESPALQKGLGAIASSLNYIGNAVEVSFLGNFSPNSIHDFQWFISCLHWSQ